MKITVEELEAYLYGLYRERVDEQALFMKLVEELGEVAEVINKRTGRKCADGDDLRLQLAEELADVIHYAAAIAAVNGIDLNEVILDKDKRASAKYGRERSMESFITERRG